MSKPPGEDCTPQEAASFLRKGAEIQFGRAIRYEQNGSNFEADLLIKEALLLEKTALGIELNNNLPPQYPQPKRRRI